jgi:hypothetical protein
METNPKSMLDIGLGNGKMGFVARDVLDVTLGEHYKRSEWKFRLDGIEVFGDYVQAHQKAIYDSIYIGDAFSVIDSLDTYDLVVLGDVLEHFPKEKGWQMLDKCFAHVNKAVALFIPLGDAWNQSAIYGNEYERHLSCWYQNEFQPMCKLFQIMTFENIGNYGAFLIYKEAYLSTRIENLKSIAFFPDGACEHRTVQTNEQSINTQIPES